MHIFEAGLVRLVVRNKTNFWVAPGRLFHQLGQFQDRNFFRIAHIEDLADGCRMIHQQ